MPFNEKRHWHSAPSSASHRGQFPMVAWAHGTSGLFRSCAPSNYRALQYHFMIPFELALEGYAVVATDYQGLGVGKLPSGKTIPHQYFSAPAGANDVAYAVEAAQKIFSKQLGGVGSPFVAMGHSEGGNVIWGFAERQAVKPIAGHRGTVAFSPPGNVIAQYNKALAFVASSGLPAAQLPTWATATLSLGYLFDAAVTAVYPAYNFSGLTAEAYDRWHNVVAPLEGCLPTSSLAFLDLTSPNKPGWQDDSTVKQWQSRVGVTGHKFANPLLVLLGENDVIPVDLIQEEVNASCEAVGAKEDLELIVYDGAEHFPVIQASRPEWMEFIREKLIYGGNNSGHRGGKCGRMSFVEAYNNNYTIHAMQPNWLVEGAFGPDMWKEIL
jgi:alpha-beta hydrolase superfamily lysophospholipase